MRNTPNKRKDAKIGGMIGLNKKWDRILGYLIRDTQMNKLVVISGASSGGKSTLLSELSNHGYTVVPEAGREIVKEQLAINGDITPWQNARAFEEMIVARSTAAYHQAKAMQAVLGQVIFFDRSFLEIVSYYQTLKTKESSKYNHLIDELRYYKTIFMAPPWKEIFCQDDERKHSFEDAVREYDRLMEFYPKCGYSIIELPKVSVKERVKFILSNLT
jgi:predicted ATPase